MCHLNFGWIQGAFQGSWPFFLRGQKLKVGVPWFQRLFMFFVYVHPLGKWSNLTIQYFSEGVGSTTTNSWKFQKTKKVRQKPGAPGLQKMFIDTVDGQNPAPPRMMIIPLFLGFHTSQVVQDFVHQQYALDIPKDLMRQFLNRVALWAEVQPVWWFQKRRLTPFTKQTGFDQGIYYAWV